MFVAGAVDVVGADGAAGGGDVCDEEAGDDEIEAAALRPQTGERLLDVGLLELEQLPDPVALGIACRRREAALKEQTPRSVWRLLGR